MDDRGRPTKHAGPSTPVEVLGLGGLPQPGDTFQAMADAAKARQIALFRQNRAKEKTLGARSGRLTLESLQQQIAEGGVKELGIIIKADVQGSAEVLADTLTKLSDERVKIRVIHAGVGAINESDVLLASTSNAIIIGFNVRPNRDAADLVDREKVDVRLHSVIYHVTDEIKKAMARRRWPDSSSRRSRKCGSARPTCGRSSRRRSSARSRAAWSPTASSSARARRRRACCATAWWCTKASSARCAYNDIKVGDVIEVFTVERIAATVS
jgi:translation initiation factor IF-2